MNSDIAISVENLSKRFRIGVEEELSDSFAESMLKTIRSPIANYRKYKSLYQFNDVKNLKVGDDNASGDILWALRDLSFEVPKGQVLGVIGTNGAGKSTLLKVLSSITPPSMGRAVIRGRVSSLLEVGTGFHQELTGRENVYLNGTIMGMTRSEVKSKFDEIVDFSGVEKFLDTPVKRYSSGMRVRLAFAVASHLEPEVLIIDEVLAVGDATFQRRSLDKMEDVSKQGRTVLFVSHNMPAVARLCSRAILLENGGLAMDGPAAEVVGHYLNDGESIRSEKNWDGDTAPGDAAVKLLGMRIKKQNNQTSSEFDVQDAVGMEMEFEVLESGRKLMPHFIVWNDSGLRIFTAIETDPAWVGKARPAGRYCTTAWIPGNLLSEGMLYVSAQMKTLEPFERHFHARQEISFQVVDSLRSGSARGAWVGGLEGAFRPKLEWETSQNESKPRLAHGF